jgi:hypothetical protein
MAMQGAESSDFYRQSRQDLRHLHGRLHRFIILLADLEQLGVPNRVSATCSCSSPSPSTPSSASCRARAGVGILRRRPAGAGLLQRHGDRRRLDVGGLLRRHGRHAVPARLRRPRLGARLDRRLRAGVDPGRRRTCASSAPTRCPDFLAFRFGGNFARFLAVIVLVCCSFTYVVAQIYGTGIIASRFLGMPFESRCSSAWPASCSARCSAACAR